VARIRSIKPEIRKSRTVRAWPREVRYAWVLLWGYLDDHGYGEDELALLKADMFPLDRDVTEKKLDGWLNLMAEQPAHDPQEAPPVCRYEVRGMRFLHAPKWTSHQKVSHPAPSRFPQCPIHSTSGGGAS
jgi:hypothetical protein